MNQVVAFEDGKLDFYFECTDGTAYTYDKILINMENTYLGEAGNKNRPGKIKLKNIDVGVNTDCTVPFTKMIVAGAIILQENGLYDFQKFMGSIDSTVGVNSAITTIDSTYGVFTIIGTIDKKTLKELIEFCRWIAEPYMICPDGIGQLLNFQMERFIEAFMIKDRDCPYRPFPTKSHEVFPLLSFYKRRSLFEGTFQDKLDILDLEDESPLIEELLKTKATKEYQEAYARSKHY